MPGDLKVAYFCNSGSEANDLAVMMAKLYTGNSDMIALRNCYHGGNMSAMGLTAHSTWKFNVPHSFGVHHTINADPYRGQWGRNDPDAGRKYAAGFKQRLGFLPKFDSHGNRVVWLHCVSVGEANAARPPGTTRSAPSTSGA